MNRWTIRFEIDGIKETRISPWMPDANAALVWLYRQKPLILRCLETLVVRPYQKGDS